MKQGNGHVVPFGGRRETEAIVLCGGMYPRGLETEWPGVFIRRANWERPRPALPWAPTQKRSLPPSSSTVNTGYSQGAPGGVGEETRVAPAWPAQQPHDSPSFSIKLLACPQVVPPMAPCRRDGMLPWSASYCPTPFPSPGRNHQSARRPPSWSCFTSHADSPDRAHQFLAPEPAPRIGTLLSLGVCSLFLPPSLSSLLSSVFLYFFFLVFLFPLRFPFSDLWHFRLGNCYNLPREFCLPSAQSCLLGLASSWVQPCHRPPSPEATGSCLWACRPIKA